MKTIFFYINSMAPAGGIERVVSTLANKLCDENKIFIIVKDSGNSFYPLNKNINIISLNLDISLNMNSRLSRFFSFFKNSLFSSIKLRFFLKKNKFDYIYVTTPLTFWECILTFNCKHKIIASEHGSRNNYNNFYKFLKIGYRLSKEYVIPTTDDYVYYKNKGYPVKYIPHFRPNIKYSKTNIKQKRVINIGRFTNDKQQILLINIWSKIIKNHQHLRDWELVIVGKGELETKIKTLIIELKLSKNIKIMSPQSDISKLYTSASLFVLSSSSEGFGMVLLEAISFGLPVVSFNCPCGPKDIIENGKDGFLIDDQDCDLMMSKLTYLMENELIRFKMSEYGFIKTKNWNANNILNKWNEIL